MTSPRNVPKLPDPVSMVWNGTQRRANAIAAWARDDALITYAQPVQPEVTAAPGTPESTWRLRVLVPVPANQGGGVIWVEVPKGATVHYGGTLVDPEFRVSAPADAFTKENA